MILILSAPSDTGTAPVEIILKKRGADFIRFDPAQFPNDAQLSIAYSDRQQNVSLFCPERIELKEISAIWHRRPGRPQPTFDDAAVLDFLNQEWRTVLADIWSTLDCVWVPAPPARERMAGYKAAQLKIALRLGFTIPPTLITSNANDLEDFYLQHGGRIVSKLATSSFNGSMLDTFVRYTEPVSRRDMGYVESLRRCPMIFQAYIPKEIELRITVVGQRVFAAEIHSQKTRHTRLDWRRYHFGATPHFVHQLPPAIEKQCVDLVATLGLCYGAIDMILTPTGEYVFLEINPNGQYGWIEEETDLPISEAICDLLLTSRTEYSDQ